MITNPKVICVMTTYGRFTCVERSIKCFLEQDYENKVLFILNTASIPLETDLKNVIICNNNIDIKTGIFYDNVGDIRKDAFNMCYNTDAIYICWDDDDIYHSKQHISRGVQGLLNNPDKSAWKPKYSYWTPNGGITFEKAENAMEASVLTWFKDIQGTDFIKSNGGEHGWYYNLWRQGLIQVDDVEPSYTYVWGESIAPHKQSGDINNPNCFEKHKQYSTDFGNRKLIELDYSVCEQWSNLIQQKLTN